MILKLGYVGVGGITNFHYIEDFTELKITSFDKEMYKYYLENGIVVYDKKHEIKGVDTMFSPEVLRENESEFMNVTFISMLDNTSSRYISFACLSDSVFLMNDNGKTIDKY